MFEQKSLSPVALAREEDHVGVGVEEGDEDARGDVECEGVLGGVQLPHVPQHQLPAAVGGEAGGEEAVLPHPHHLGGHHKIIILAWGLHDRFSSAIESKHFR